MRSGPRAGATRSSAVLPSLRPGPRASRADLDIINDYVFSGGQAPLLHLQITARLPALSGSHRIAGDGARRSDDHRGARAGDTVLVTLGVARGAALHVGAVLADFLPARPRTSRSGGGWPRPSRRLSAARPPPPMLCPYFVRSAR